MSSPLISTIDITKAIKRYQEAVPPDYCLAQVVRIVDVYPIQGADLIESYKVLGWNCVGRKSEFKVGDLVVYIKIGSVLDPTVEHFTFLEGRPLKTKKIRGAISQGLICPLTWLHEDQNRVEEGEDVTSQLKVLKYVEQGEKGVYSKSNLGNGLQSRPEFIPKTDEERVQNLTKRHWDQLAGQKVIVTRKEDGCSATYYFFQGTFGITSRNCKIEADNKELTHYICIAEEFRLEKKLTELGRELAIQGEIVGPKINCNRLKLSKLDFRVFNIFDISTGIYLEHDEVVQICDQLGLHMVQYLTDKIITDDMLCSDFWLKLAERVEYSPGIPAEGVVVKTGSKDKGLSRRISFKAISNLFLLKHNL